MPLDTISPVVDAILPVADAPGTPVRRKFRVRFRKAGDLRFVSHHDLMHIFERTFRRADLHLHITQGFNPRPRMWFALSLALGIAGLNEVLEIEVADPLDAGEVQHRLAERCPPGIDVLSVRLLEPRLAARVRRSWYRISSPLPLGEGPGVRASDSSPLPLGEGLRVEPPAPSVSPLDPIPRDRVEQFLARPDCWITRTKPPGRRINLRPFVSELHARDNAIDMALWISPKGAARPEEVVAALGLASWLDAGAVIERTDLEIIDELPPDSAAAPNLEHAFGEIQSYDADLAEETVSSRPTAIISNPLSFET